MAATKQDIRGWFEKGIENGATHLIVVCDTYDHDDYPVYVEPSEDVRKRHADFNGKNMQKVMEVYNLSQNMEEQLNEHRAMRF